MNYHIKQEDPSGCAIACVAMLANIKRNEEFWTYQKVKSIWLKNCNGKEDIITTNTSGAGGLRITEVWDLMHLMGLSLEFPNMAPCIVIISRPNGWHYIVLDKLGNILDPNKES